MTQINKTIKPEEVLQRLKDGNRRFARNESKYPHCDSLRRKDVTANGQHPIATVISCSDSRVPVELIFDQGIGDIFVVRVAGNVCANDEIGSIEYGVGHAGSPLCIVLGHTHCGAVTAVASGAEVHGCIPKLVEPIMRPVDQAKAEFPDVSLADLVSHATKLNVIQAMDDLVSNSPDISQLVDDGTVLVVGAVYDIESGLVNWLFSHG